MNRSLLVKSEQTKQHLALFGTDFETSEVVDKFKNLQLWSVVYITDKLNDVDQLVQMPLRKKKNSKHRR